jgi:sugar lactone lactonase YvrE
MSWTQVYNSRTYRMLCLVAIAVAFIAISCKKQDAAPPVKPAAAPEESAAVEHKEPPHEVAAAKPEEKVAVEQPIVVKDAGFMTPESILYDDKNDVYLVSNINGAADGKDNNGFISKIGPDGTVITLKWIEGGQNKVELNAPKGMAFRDDMLFVTDINCVRMFDRASGAPKGKIDVKGASFLNDLSAAPNGTIYLSDSGMKSGKDGLVPTGKDAVYRIDAKNKVKKLISGKELRQPNGLLAEDGGVFVVTMGGNEMYRILDDGKRESSLTVPGGSLDGVVKIKDGGILVSSWEASTVYRSDGGGPFTAAWAELKSPADIGYDSGRNRLLVPMFLENAIEIQPIAESKNAAPTTVTAQKEPSAPAAAPAPATASSAKPGVLKPNAPEPETAASKEDKSSKAAASKEEKSKKVEPSSSAATSAATSSAPAPATGVGAPSSKAAQPPSDTKSSSTTKK